MAADLLCGEAFGGAIVSANFEELDYRPTPIGAVSLRRRHDLALGIDVYDIKLGDDFLMSSNYTASERALATLALASLGDTRPEAARSGCLDVVVGGLGLGFTAQAVLEHNSVGSLTVIDYLAAVIEWHETGLIPLGAELTSDPRCRLVHADFFALATADAGFDPSHPGRRFDAVLVDIDHSPDAFLAAGNADFYSAESLARMSRHLKPGGVFGLWSNEPPDALFVARLQAAFATARGEPVTFENTANDRFTQTVYLAWSEIQPAAAEAATSGQP